MAAPSCSCPCWRCTPSKATRGRDVCQAQAKVSPTRSSQHCPKGKGTGVTCRCTTPGRILHRGTLLLQNRTLRTSHRFHFCPVPPVQPGPQLAQSASPESQQAAPVQPLLRRERQEKSGHDLPYIPLLHLQSPQVHGLFPAQLSKMQTPLGMLAATLLSRTTASLRSLSQAVCGNTSPLSSFSDLSHFKFSTKYICKA